MRLSFVIPALNEREGIRVTMNKLPVDSLRRAGHEVEVLVVDGASPDGTGEVAAGLGARVVTERRLGYGRAYKTGFDEARGHVLVTGDADGSYPLEETIEYLRMLESGPYDFLTVNRFGHVARGAMGPKHRFGNWILNTTMRLLFGIRLRDSQSGMWILRRHVLEALPYREFAEGMPFSEELKVRAFRHPGLRCLEVPGRYSRRTGDPKLSSWRDGWRNLRHLLRLRFRRSPRGNG